MIGKDITFGGKTRVELNCLVGILSQIFHLDISDLSFFSFYSRRNVRNSTHGIIIRVSRFLHVSILEEGIYGLDGRRRHY